MQIVYPSINHPNALAGLVINALISNNEAAPGLDIKYTNRSGKADPCFKTASGLIEEAKATFYCLYSFSFNDVDPLKFW